MHVKRLRISNFKRFRTFTLELNDRFNIIVGDNETGKSTVLEALGLVLSGQYEGRLAAYGIDPYLFNADAVSNYFAKRAAGEQAPPPRIVIEAYLGGTDDDPLFARLMGTNNDLGENCPGLALTVEVSPEHGDDLKEYAADQSNPTVLPVEFYKPSWRSFNGDSITLRRLPFRIAKIDASVPRIVRGPNHYLSQVVADVLDDSQRRELGLEYKRLRHKFSQEPGVEAINQFLAQQGGSVTSKKLSVQMDLSSRATWHSSITAHLDDLPFDCSGKGEQCRVQLRLAIAGAQLSQVILLEEPENHLAHSNLTALLEDIRADCTDRQVVVTTHSPFVLNKLGIDNLKLVSHSAKTIGLSNLSPSTRDYFMRLPGYDTLRLILAKRSILVEGPSDELIVQRAYERRHQRTPLANGIDVIAVGSLAFRRFLEIAKLLHLDVTVITDNDGDVNSLRKRYADYLGDSHPHIRVLFDDDEASPTLEPQLLKANTRETLNAALGKTFQDREAILTYMKRNKTDCALRFFETDTPWNAPSHILNAIE